MKKPLVEIVDVMDGGEAIDFLIDNIQGYIVDEQEIAKIKADAVREAIKIGRYNGTDGQGWEMELEQYLTELEATK